MKHAYIPRTTNYTLNPGDELNDLRMSDQVRPLYEHVKKFIRETVEPMSVEFYRHGENKKDRWSFTDGQLDVLDKAKKRNVHFPQRKFAIKVRKETSLPVMLKVFHDRNTAYQMKCTR